MYIFDTSAIISFSFYYPDHFPGFWKKIQTLVDEGTLRSIKEVYRELDVDCAFPHISEWVKSNKGIFMKPTLEEMQLVATIMQKEVYRGLVKKECIRKGKAVADPFV